MVESNKLVTLCKFSEVQILIGLFIDVLYMSTAKTIVLDMLAGLRLDGHNNYDQWHRKMKYLLSENGSINFITEEIKPLIDRDNPDEV